MEKIKFADGWQEYFSRFDLNSFQGFYEYSAGNVINSNTKRNVMSFSLGSGDNKKELFMKRFFKPHFKDMLFTFSNYGRLLSQGELEWQNAYNLINIGVDTYVPVCFGQNTVCGIEKRSFVITEKLTDQCFTDFIPQHWQNLPDEEKNEIMSGIGRLLRKVHDAKMALPDFFTWHIYLSKLPDGKYKFAVIDLHRMKLNVRSEKVLAKDMGAFYYSMIEEYFDQTHKEALLSAYLGNDTSRRKRFESRVLNREAVLKGRRRKPSY